MKYDYAVSENPIQSASSSLAPSFPPEDEKPPETASLTFSEGKLGTEVGGGTAGQADRTTAFFQANKRLASGR